MQQQQQHEQGAANEGADGDLSSGLLLDAADYPPMQLRGPCQRCKGSKVRAWCQRVRTDVGGFGVRPKRRRALRKPDDPTV